MTSPAAARRTWLSLAFTCIVVHGQRCQSGFGLVGSAECCATNVGPPASLLQRGYQTQKQTQTGMLEPLRQGDETPGPGAAVLLPPSAAAEFQVQAQMSRAPYVLAAVALLVLCGAQCLQRQLAQYAKEQEKQEAPESEQKKSGQSQEKEAGESGDAAKLLEKYSLGKTLGEGAFGVVYACRMKGTKQKFAVKMIDLVETPLAEVQREVDMLKLLAHPCICGLKDVFYEKVFVCLVMELYEGGDMVEGMQSHWQSKGMIPLKVIQNVSKMMVQGMEFMHQNRIVHRDLKGDNFLMSVKQIEDPACRVYMCDFGTVVAVKKGERLSEKCGTKIYWAPEFHKRDYGLEVDVWATGVIIFGLLTTRTPFKNEADVADKEVRVPSRASKDGSSFLQGVFKKKAKERFTAKQCLKHVFLNSAESAAPVMEEADEEKVEEKIEKKDNEFGACKTDRAGAGVMQRRALLVNRLEDAQIAQHSGTKIETNIHEDFEVPGANGKPKSRYEWWDSAKVKQAGFITAGGLRPPALDNTLTNERTTTMLEEHKVDTSKFGQGQAKKLSEFLSEVQTGESRLMLDATKHKNMVRVIDVVLLRIAHGSDESKRYLITMSEKFPDGRERFNLNNLPGTKKRPHENGRQVVERIMKERLDLCEFEITFDFVNKECMEVDEESPSYPGVRTVYRKEIFEGQVLTTDKKKLTKLGVRCKRFQHHRYVVEGKDRYIRTFGWFSEETCNLKGIKMRAPKEGCEVSPLVPTPVGYDKEELHKFLEVNNVDLSTFAEGKAEGSLAKLAEELQMGEAALTRMPDGRILRVVEVVVLLITKKSGETLVQAPAPSGGASKKKERLPGMKLRQDEHPFWASKRLMDQMRINENKLTIDVANVKLLEEEKPSEVYKNIPTIYRRRIIPTTLIED